MSISAARLCSAVASANCLSSIKLWARPWPAGTGVPPAINPVLDPGASLSIVTAPAAAVSRCRLVVSAKPVDRRAAGSATIQHSSSRSASEVRTCGTPVRAVTAQFIWRTSSPMTYSREPTGSEPSPVAVERKLPRKSPLSLRVTVSSKYARTRARSSSRADIRKQCPHRSQCSRPGEGARETTRCQ